jgi:hypothetical protein
MSSAFIPGTASIMPMSYSRLTPVAPKGPSWPHELTTILASMTLGSMQDCVSWFIDTSAQLVTTPATRYDSGGKIPTNAQDLGAPVHSIDPHRVNGRKNNKHASGGTPGPSATPQGTRNGLAHAPALHSPSIPSRSTEENKNKNR